MQSHFMPFTMDEDLLEGLRNDHQAAYGQLYDAFFSVAHYIKRNQGSYKDTEDVFQ